MIYNGRHSLFLDQNNRQLVVFESFCGAIKTFAALTYVDRYGCRYFWDEGYGFGFALPINSEFRIPNVEVFPNGLVAWMGPYTVPDLHQPNFMSNSSGSVLTRSANTCFGSKLEEEVETVGSTISKKRNPSASEKLPRSSLLKNTNEHSSVGIGVVSLKANIHEGNTDVQEGAQSLAMHEPKGTVLADWKNERSVLGAGEKLTMVSIEKKAVMAVSKNSTEVSSKPEPIGAVKKCKCPRCKFVQAETALGEGQMSYKTKQGFRGEGKERRKYPRNISKMVPLEVVGTTQMNRRTFTSI